MNHVFEIRWQRYGWVTGRLGSEDTDAIPQAVGRGGQNGTHLVQKKKKKNCCRQKTKWLTRYGTAVHCGNRLLKLVRRVFTGFKKKVPLFTAIHLMRMCTSVVLSVQ